MTIKDYQMLAAALNRFNVVVQRYTLKAEFYIMLRQLMRDLKRDNPEFDPKKFCLAIGVKERDFNLVVDGI